VHCFRHDEAQTAEHFGPNRNAYQRRPSVGIVALAGGQNRRHDHRAGVNRAALESIVEILAMRGGAIDKGRATRSQRALMADHCARAIIFPTRKRAGDIIFVAGGDTQADHIDQEIFAFALGQGGQRIWFHADDFVGQQFRDRRLWQLACHCRDQTWNSLE
jgi:hypothetical protein